VAISHLPQRIVDLLGPNDRQEYARHVGHPGASLTSTELKELDQKLIRGREEIATGNWAISHAKGLVPSGRHV
jgi:hypothetical protein